MPVLFRIFAVALLLVAIPVQGMASVMAGQCMAFGHHQDAGSHDHEHAQDGRLCLDSHAHSLVLGLREAAPGGGPPTRAKRTRLYN